MDSQENGDSNSIKNDYQHNDWYLGFRDGSNNLTPEKLKNINYLMGWYEGKGMFDGKTGIVSINFKDVQDTLLFHSYFKSFQLRQYEQMFDSSDNNYHIEK